MLKALFVLYLHFCPDMWYVKKRLDKKAYVNLKIYDVTGWTTNNCKTYIVQYLKKQLTVTRQ